MKKISTAATKQSKNVSEQKLTIGLDLGDRWSWYCVLDEAGAIVLEQKLGPTPKAMKEVFGAMPRSRIALETGMHSPWVSRVLSELGHEVIVAHARNVRLIGESRKKDDRLDAQTLARLARIDPQLLSPVKHRSAKAQADLTVIRARAGLVRARTALVNTARGSRSVFHKARLQRAALLFLPPALHLDPAGNPTRSNRSFFKNFPQVSRATPAAANSRGALPMLIAPRTSPRSSKPDRAFPRPTCTERRVA